MKIELITQEEYATLLKIQEERPILTFQNVGYEYIDKSKFSDEDWEAFNTVTGILKKSIVGFSEFNNFNLTKTGRKKVRFQYNYGAEDNSIPFTGVGYLLIEELHFGFFELTDKS